MHRVSQTVGSEAMVGGGGEGKAENNDRETNPEENVQLEAGRLSKSSRGGAVSATSLQSPSLRLRRRSGLVMFHGHGGLQAS